MNLFNETQVTQAVWIFDLARGTKSRLTFGDASQLSPTWSPDGKTIFYESNSKGAFHIYSKAADGSGAERAVIESNDAEQGVPACSPDRRYLVYLTRSASHPSTDVWIVPLFGDRSLWPTVSNG